MKWTPSVAFFVLTFAVLARLLGCAPSSSTTWQEPVVAWTRTSDGNPVAFGSSVPAERRAETVAAIASSVRGRLPGVRFYVVKHPALVGTVGVTSFREPRSGLVVVSWRIDRARGYVVEDVPWEVEHMVAGTWDDGTPVLGGPR